MVGHSCSRGPAYGYLVNKTKTWLVVKESKESEARELFGDTDTYPLPPKGDHTWGCQWAPSLTWRTSSVLRWKYGPHLSRPFHKSPCRILMQLMLPLLMGFPICGCLCVGLLRIYAIFLSQWRRSSGCHSYQH